MRNFFFILNFFSFSPEAFPAKKNWLKKIGSLFFLSLFFLSWSLDLKCARKTPSPIQEPDTALFSEAQEAVGALGGQGVEDDPIYEAMEFSSPPLPARNYGPEHKVQMEAPPKKPPRVTTSFISPRLAKISEEINEDIDLK